MNVVHIPVQYPSVVSKVMFTESEMRVKGYKNYKGDLVRNTFVNRTHHITVKQTARKVQEEFMATEDYEAELEAKCLEQTGLTRAQYQLKHKRAWND